MKGSSDGALVAAVLDGDVDAFGILIGRHRDAHARFAVRMLGTLLDADDVLQTAYLRAFRALRQCREPDRVGAWLYQIVVNECRTFVAQHRRRELHVVSDPVALEHALAPQAADDAVAMEEIERALALLVPAQREAFLLKHVDELSYEEMSDLTGTSVPALKMRVKRACEQLRGLLNGVYHAR